MALDITQPTDETQVSKLAEYIRETRAAIFKDGISGVSFESDVDEYDAVFLDSTSNVWRRSRAGTVDRDRFHGIALAESGVVLVFGRVQYDGWDFQEGQNVYVSSTQLGHLQTDPTTALFAGVAVSVDSLLIDSQISAAFDSLKAEIVAARGTFSALSERLDDSDSKQASVIFEVEAARSGSDSVNSRLTTMQDEITANTNKTALHDATTSEVEAARNGAPSLDNRLDDMEANVTSAINISGANRNEIVAARGAALSLSARLNTSLNPDGSLKSSVTVSTFIEEAALFTRINDTQFAVTGDNTATYNNRRKVRINDTIVAPVVMSEFPYGTDKTLVTISGIVLPSPMDKLEYGMNPNDLPYGLHSELTDALPADPTDSSSVGNKHVSNLQAKKWEDHANAEGNVHNLTLADIGAEPAFAKNTAFNKNFGVLDGTVCEGNDVRLSDNRDPKAHTHTVSDITDLPDIPSAASEAVTDAGVVSDEYVAPDNLKLWYDKKVTATPSFVLSATEVERLRITGTYSAEEGASIFWIIPADITDFVDKGDGTYAFTAPEVTIDTDYEIGMYAKKDNLHDSAIVKHTITITDFPTEAGPTMIFSNSDGWDKQPDAVGIQPPAVSIGLNNTDQIISASPEIVQTSGMLSLLDGTTASVLKVASLLNVGDMLVTDQGESEVASVDSSSVLGTLSTTDKNANIAVTDKVATSNAAGYKWGSMLPEFAGKKVYVEFWSTGVSSSSYYMGVGICPASLDLTAANYTQGTVQGTDGLYHWLETVPATNKYMVAVDEAAGKVWFGKNNIWDGGGDPAAGTSPTYTFTPGTSLKFCYLLEGDEYAGAIKTNLAEAAYVAPDGFSYLDQIGFTYNATLAQALSGVPTKAAIKETVVIKLASGIIDQVFSSDDFNLIPATYTHAFDGDLLKITGSSINLNNDPTLKRLAMKVESPSTLRFSSGKIYIMEAV